MTETISSPSLIDLVVSEHVNGRVQHTILTANLSSPPTQAELTAAIDDPADSPGLILIADDNAADTAVYLIVSNGQSWHYVSLTKAI